MPYTPINERKQYDGFGRIQLDDDAPDTEIADITNPANLSSSVGESGQNNRRDVAKVETMLGETGALDLKQTDGPTGYWGTRTADATKKVQADNGLKVDAQINPGGPTIQKLGQITDARHATKRRKDRRDQSRRYAQIRDESEKRKHFEERESKNMPLPNSIRRADRAGFKPYPHWQNVFHDNWKGLPELKMGHEDGREVIFDGDTRERISDPNKRGTYNYAVVPSIDPYEADLELWLEFLEKGKEHFELDIEPALRFGNRRIKKRN